MALTPEQIAEIQRLKALMQPAANEAQRKAQAQWNAEQMAKQQGKAKGGSAHDKALKVFMKGTKAKERLYHGTGNLEGLTSFDPALTGKGTDQLGSGFYLSNDPEEASGYAGKFHAHTGQENPSPGVIPAHVAIRNPIKIGKKGMSLNDARINLSHDQVKQIMEYVPDLRHPERSPLYNHVDTSRGVTPQMINDIAKLYTGNALHALENDLFYDNPTAYRTALNKVLGYDGVVKDFGNGRKHYVAWFPNQIKSAIGNRGTYDPNDPDITKAKGGQVSQDAMQLALLNKGGGLSKFLKDSKEKRKLYHATFANVRRFDSNAPKQTDQDTGAHFFTPDIDFANQHIGTKGHHEPLDQMHYNKGANIMPVVVHTKNPWDYENPSHVDALHAGLVNHPYIGAQFAPEKHRLASGDWSIIEDPAVQEVIKKMGHDAFYTEEGGVKNIGIYNRRHIKSLHGNRGTYDRRSSDITKAKGGSVTHAHHLEIEERPL